VSFQRSSSTDALVDAHDANVSTLVETPDR